MKTTYTIETRMPLPTVGVVALEERDTLGDAGALLVALNTNKTEEWLQAIKRLIAHPSALFGTIVDGAVVVSLTDETVAKEFEAKWGGDA